jgi:hypothetical protein
MPDLPERNAAIVASLTCPRVMRETATGGVASRDFEDFIDRVGGIIY